MQGSASLRGLFFRFSPFVWLLLFEPPVSGQAKPMIPNGPYLQPSKEYVEIDRLKTIAEALPKPGPHDWLSRHKEYGENFEQYLRSQQDQKHAKYKRIVICLLGEFSPEQEKVLQTTLDYLNVFYNVPVEIQERISSDKIPAHAQRKHPKWGDHQVFTQYVLIDLLKPKCPPDALAYLCFTSHDLYPDDKWNFVYGQASLKHRIGVWSIYRNGDPAESRAAYRTCLERTMKVATHETGHILGLVHCIAYRCNMNGVNNLDEADRQWFHFCPVCLRKVCWSLQLQPEPYLKGLQKFCEEHEFPEEAKYYELARRAFSLENK